MKRISYKRRKFKSILKIFFPIVGKGRSLCYNTQCVLLQQQRKGRCSNMKAQKQKFGPMPVLAITLVGSICGFILRKLMLAHGYDELGIQITGSLPYVGLWALTFLVLGGLGFFCYGMGTRSSMAANWKPSVLACVGGVVSGLLLAGANLIAILDNPSAFQAAACYLGMISGVVVACGGFLRLKGKHYGPLGMVVPLYLALWVVTHFTVWSTDPLLGDYCFQLLACIFSMLASVHLAGFPIGRGSRRLSLFYALGAVYFCSISLAHREEFLFYLAMLLWLVTGLCDLHKPVRRRKLGGGFTEEGEKDHG